MLRAKKKVKTTGGWKKNYAKRMGRQLNDMTRKRSIKNFK
jgi:hypothetical protein